MNTTNHHTFSSHKVAATSTLMCVVAMLVLIISCPLKRMLQNKVVSNTLPVSKSNPSGVIQTAGKYLNSNPACFFASQKIFSVKPEKSRNSTLPSPLYLPAINEQVAIDIHYVQSGLHLTDFNTASNHYAELPLFLQHMRLLI